MYEASPVTADWSRTDATSDELQSKTRPRALKWCPARTTNATSWWGLSRWAAAGGRLGCRTVHLEQHFEIEAIELVSRDSSKAAIEQSIRNIFLSTLRYEYRGTAPPIASLQPAANTPAKLTQAIATIPSKLEAQLPSEPNGCSQELPPPPSPKCHHHRPPPSQGPNNHPPKTPAKPGSHKHHHPPPHPPTPPQPPNPPNKPAPA